MKLNWLDVILGLAPHVFRTLSDVLSEWIKAKTKQHTQRQGGERLVCKKRRPLSRRTTGKKPIQKI